MIRRGVALCAATTSVSLLVATPAPAVESRESLGLVEKQEAPGWTGSSLIYGLRQIGPDTPPLAIPIILIGAMMSGIFGHLLFGRFVFEGSSRAAQSLGSSTVVDQTFPDPDAPPAQFRKLEHLQDLSLIHISEPTRPCGTSRMPSSA